MKRELVDQIVKLLDNSEDNLTLTLKVEILQEAISTLKIRNVKQRINEKPYFDKWGDETAKRLF